jgi:serine protease Do
MRMHGIIAAFAGAVLAATMTAASADAAVPPPPQGPQSVAALAKRLLPAVVNISSMHRLGGGQGVPRPKAPEGSSPDLSSRDGAPGDSQSSGPAEDEESLGSGFITSADGLVVTNNHVVEGADQVQVFLTDGTHFPATVIGTDSKTDLALLRIDAGHPLPFVKFGDSDAAQVGDWVMAIGNPFGLGGSVTLGIVSARNRDIQSGPYDSYIQTDASINQGNSGGPLFDMNGNVVGINTAIIAEGGASLGIGFAIPGDLAKPVVEQLAQFGEARRGWLGVGIQDVTEDIAASLGRTDTHGAMVTDVAKSGPANGVLDEGDIILDFDGRPIATMHDLPRLVAETSVGKVVPLTVLRDGRQEVVSITLGRLKDGDSKAKPVTMLSSLPKKAAPAAETLDDLLGFHLEPINPVNRKTYALSSSIDGLVVTRVKSGSDADNNGIAPGVVITAVNRKNVSAVTDVQTIVDEARKLGRTAVLFRAVDASGAGRFIGVKFAG